MSEITDFYSSWLGCNIFGNTSSGLAAPIPIPFSPTDISDCSIWFDATDNTTITLGTGDNVVAWFNKGDLSGSMVPYPGEATPQTNTHDINGNNVIWFGPFQTLYQNLQFSNQAYTFFVVTKTLLDPATDNYVDWFGAFTSGGFSTGLSEYLGTYYLGCGANAIDNYVMNGSATYVDKPVIYTIRSSSDLSGNVIYQDSFPLDLNVANQFLGYNTNPLDFFIHIYTHPSSLDIGELIVYNRALQDDEVLSVQEYLSGKYSIAI